MLQFEKIVRKLRDGRVYSWRQNDFNLSQSKRRDLYIYSILNRGYSGKNMNNVCFALNNALEGYKDADRFVVTVLMPEFFIFMCISYFKLSFCEIDSYLHFLGFYMNKP